jgi:hypothetical protein
LNGQNEALRKIEERLRIHVRPRLQLRVAR